MIMHTSTLTNKYNDRNTFTWITHPFEFSHISKAITSEQTAEARVRSSIDLYVTN